MIRQPNILWIVSDHQLHATRPDGFDEFPLQRKLAGHGIEFSRAYSVLPICSPARASMLTGLYPHAHGLTENDGRFGGREGLDPSDWTVNRAFIDAGYRCAWFGKWHVDNYRSALDYGFEGFSLPGYGYPYATGEYREYLQRKDLAPPIARIEMAGESGLASGSEVDLLAQTNWFEYESGVAVLDGPAQAHEAFFVADLARQWIETAGDDPFFMRVDSWGPHPPYLLAEPWLDRLADLALQLPENFHCDLQQRPQHHRTYRDFWQQRLEQNPEQWLRFYRHALEHVLLVESALVELLDVVDLDNTLVLFNSDHGDAASSNGGIANKGGLMSEATMRIPLLMAGAGLPAGRACAQLACNLDLAPTLLDFCAIETGRLFHGRSLVPLLHDQSAALRAGLMTQHYGLHEAVTQRAWYEDRYKLVIQADGFSELYDLGSDPGELDNLAGRGAYAGQEARMREQLRAAMLEAGDRQPAFSV